ncbi:hypothetical protein VCHA36P166_190063 [Vibrio chagasii]|nr:hypothetical protein VCHA36P166_190063 [Vibrio chagasii]
MSCVFVLFGANTYFFYIAPIALQGLVLVTQPTTCKLVVSVSQFLDGQMRKL